MAYALLMGICCIGVCSAWDRQLNFRRFNLSFDIEEGDYITFKMDAFTNGWIGVRFATDILMETSDCVIGWIVDGLPYVEDQFIKGEAPPEKDVSQDVKLLAWEEKNGFTSLTFRRKKITGDTNDFDIKSSMSYVGYLRSEKDPAESTFQAHDYKTFSDGVMGAYLMLKLNKMQQMLEREAKIFDPEARSLP